MSEARKKKEYTKRECHWADLQPELLELIMGRLLFIDQLYFRATCKSWGSLARVPPLKQLPWLVVFNDERNYTYILHDPAYERTYKTSIAYPAHLIFSDDSKIIASKFGWLLVSYSTLLFFFNPFSKQVIQLRGPKNPVSKATFSSPPTDPECIIFALYCSDNVTKINTCALKDEKWIAHEPCTSFGYVQSVVYSQRNLYLVDWCRALGILNIDTMELKFFPGEKRIEFLFYGAHLVYSDGDILFVLNDDDLQMLILRYDFRKMKWVKVTRLENRTLFLGCTSTAVHSSISELTDRVHFHFGGESKFFSLKGDRCFNCNKYYRGGGVYWNRKREWIEPPY